MLIDNIGNGNGSTQSNYVPCYNKEDMAGPHWVSHIMLTNEVESGD